MGSNKNRTQSNGRKSRNQEGSNTETKKPKTKDIDFEYRIGDASQAAIFVRLTDAIAIHVRKTYSFAADIASILEQKQDFDIDATKPSLAVPTLFAKYKETAE